MYQSVIQSSLSNKSQLLHIATHLKLPINIKSSNPGAFPEIYPFSLMRVLIGLINFLKFLIVDEIKGLNSFAKADLSTINTSLNKLIDGKFEKALFLDNYLSLF